MPSTTEELQKEAWDYIKEALRDFNKIILLNPDYTDIFYNRGIVRGKLGDPKGAIEDFNKAIELNPSLGEAYFNRGLIKDFIGDYAGACKDWSKAGELHDYGAYDLIKQYCK